MSTHIVSPLDDYKAALSQLPPTALLGVMTWYSISGEVERIDGKRVTGPVRVTREFLAEQFERLNLDDRLLPPPIKKFDAFRQASSEIKAEYTLPGNVDRTAVIRVWELKTEREGITRLVLRDVKDRRSKNVNTTVVAELYFSRGSSLTRGTAKSGETVKARVNNQLREVNMDLKETGKSQDFDPVEKARVEGLISTFRARYADLSENYSAQAIRAVIRNYLTHLNAIACKPSGGIYFVHIDRLRQVAALEQLVESIGQGCTFHTLPLENTDKQKNMLTEAFQAEVQDECQLLMADIAKEQDRANSKGEAVKPEKYAEFSRRLSLITHRSAEYVDKLGLAQEKSADSIMSASDLVEALAEQLPVRTTASKGR